MINVVESASKPIIMLGAGGQGRVLADLVRQLTGVHLVGVVDDFAPLGSVAFDVKVIGRTVDIPMLLRQLNARKVVLAVGDNYHRVRLFRQIEIACGGDVEWPVLVHPRAIVAESAELQQGSVVLAGAVVGPGAVLEPFTLINTLASVDHDCHIALGASIGPGAILGGNVRVDRGAIVALGARVINGISLGKHVLLAAGAAAVKNLPDYAVAFGIPAQIRRFRANDEPYL